MKVIIQVLFKKKLDERNKKTIIETSKLIIYYITISKMGQKRIVNLYVIGRYSLPFIDRCLFFLSQKLHHLNFLLWYRLLNLVHLVRVIYTVICYF